MTAVSRRGLLSAVAVAGSLTTPPAWGAASADADLIRICAEHEANHYAVDAYPNDIEDDDHPLWADYLRTQSAVDDAKPITMDGMLAKARLAVVVSTHNGEVTPENGRGATWAWDLLNDLIRMDDGAA